MTRDVADLIQALVWLVLAVTKLGRTSVAFATMFAVVARALPGWYTFTRTT